MKNNRILIIDDEISILKYLGSYLRREGFEVITANNGKEGLILTEQANPLLIILDISMPELDGFEVCRRLREWTAVPIIMLSAIDNETDKVKCLNLGADDYITKPFGIYELLARINAVLRRLQPVAAVRSSFTSQDFKMMFAERRVTIRDKEIKLTPTEYNLLQELVVNAGKVLTHVHLLQKIWGSEYRDEKDYLHVYIGHLRDKMEDNPAEPKYILTIPGVGYQFRRPESPPDNSG
jgi:two-component system KDP operon response regulator KdpE